MGDKERERERAREAEYVKESERSREDENALARERIFVFGCVACLTILHSMSSSLGVCFLA